ncbi:AAA family ATPase [Chromobacterium sp. ASV23]|uniref:AAA family ATPase n=1 Tax=Chromobacterium sp. ASV23 TaxID=2795110 RepID=UPI0018EBBF8D|nr:AAA family ATPase [Chromobacterium sp. ASV23]
MTMIYGLTGAHRTGKTTLAQAVADRLQINFLKTDVSGVLAKLGIDPAADVDFKTRMRAQHAVLDALDAAYGAASADCITDRTPLDAIAYTLADVRRESVVDEAELSAYLARAFDMLNRRFSMVCLVQPGIPLIEEEGKAPATAGYVEHIAQLAAGLVVDDRVSVMARIIASRVVDLSDRVDCVIRAIQDSTRYASELRAGELIH